MEGRTTRFNKRAVCGAPVRGGGALSLPACACVRTSGRGACRRGGRGMRLLLVQRDGHAWGTGHGSLFAQGELPHVLERRLCARGKRGASGAEAQASAADIRAPDLPWCSADVMLQKASRRGRLSRNAWNAMAAGQLPCHLGAHTDSPSATQPIDRSNCCSSNPTQCSPHTPRARARLSEPRRTHPQLVPYGVKHGKRLEWTCLLRDHCMRGKAARRP